MFYIPSIIEKNAAGERVFDIYSCLLKERIILCVGEIQEEMASSIIAQLLYLSSLSNDEITMYIHSPGGSIAAGLAIYDTMNYIQCDIVTIGMGSVASMASILLCAGTFNKRCVLKNCEVMIHQPMGSASGQVSDVAIATAHLFHVQKKVYEILAFHTHKSFEQILLDCDRDYYFDAEKAISYGLADRII